MLHRCKKIQLGFLESLFALFVGAAFMRYGLPNGQMSLWELQYNSIPSFIEWRCGGHYVPTLKRFFVFHFLLPFLL